MRPVRVPGARNPVVLTVLELAEYLQVDKAQLYRMLKAGALPGFKIGSDWRFNVEAIRQWVTRNDAISVKNGR